MPVLKNARHEAFAGAVENCNRGGGKNSALVESGMANRFYVYELSDPRTGQVFYVGKGCGQRAFRHEAEARNGRVGNAEKHCRITDILKSGVKPVVSIIADNLSEQDAFTTERERIRHHGYKSLTNILPGTLTAREKSKLQAAIDVSMLKPHEQWMAEAPRSGFEIALALRVRAELAHIAEHGQVISVTISKRGVEFR